MTKPIDPQNYQYGLNVVDIGDLRIARGLTRRVLHKCAHKRLVFDEAERRVWCQDCESEVEPFDAFRGLCENYNAAVKRIEKREQAVKEAEAHALISRASKVMDEYWRQRSLVPCCPHCGTGLLPDDVVKGLSRVSKEIEVARRKRDKP